MCNFACGKRSYVTWVQMPAAIVLMSEDPTRTRLPEPVTIPSDARIVQKLHKNGTIAKHYLSLCMKMVREWCLRKVSHSSARPQDTREKKFARAEGASEKFWAISSYILENHANLWSKKLDFGDHKCRFVCLFFHNREILKSRFVCIFFRIGLIHNSNS